MQVVTKSHVHMIRHVQTKRASCRLRVGRGSFFLEDVETPPHLRARSRAYLCSVGELVHKSKERRFVVHDTHLINKTGPHKCTDQADSVFYVRTTGGNERYNDDSVRVRIVYM